MLHHQRVLSSIIFENKFCIAIVTLDATDWQGGSLTFSKNLLAFFIEITQILLYMLFIITHRCITTNVSGQGRFLKIRALR